MAAPNTHAMALQAGLRTLHEIGPELKRAISGTLDPGFIHESEEPQHRVVFIGWDVLCSGSLYLFSEYILFGFLLL